MVSGNSKTIVLSKREKEILDLVSKGYLCCEIAKKLNISETTVITHKNNLRIKLKAKNSSHAIMQAVLLGFL